MEDLAITVGTEEMLSPPETLMPKLTDAGILSCYTSCFR